MTRYLVISFFILLNSPGPLMAWHAKGHEIVADIAKSLLRKNILDSVAFYLESPDFEKAAVWMDEVRGHPSFNFLKPMHYINIAKDQTYVKTNEANIMNAIEKSIMCIKNRRQFNKEEIKIQLLILFHLIGDLHQPLHVGYADDKGGNEVHLLFQNKKTNLHKLWDGDIITYENISLNNCLARLNALNNREKQNIQHIDLLAWMNDSRGYLSEVYHFKNNTIALMYADKNKSIIEGLLIKAGMRLAALLDDCFKQASI